MLAEIATPEVDAQLEQARATLLLTRANLLRDQATEELARIDLIRSRNLLSRQAAPQQEYDSYAAQAKIAGANVKATESTLKVYQANIQRLETLQSFQKVTAPFSGVITARNIDPGDLVSADSPTSSREMFHLVQMNTLRSVRQCPTSVLNGRQGRPTRNRLPSRRPQADVCRHNHENGRSSTSVPTVIIRAPLRWRRGPMVRGWASWTSSIMCTTEKCGLVATSVQRPRWSLEWKPARPSWSIRATIYRRGRQVEPLEIPTK